MRFYHFISRIVVGVVFIFSGFVKGIDPLGMAYRLEDYFYAWGTEWMLPAALTLSIILSTAEFVLGVVVLFNLKPKVNAWLLLGMMLFFTGLTFIDAIYNPVPDCGCFGDAIKLTNWQTFYKNVVLMVPTLVLFIWRNKTKDQWNNFQAYGAAGVFALVFIWLSLHCYRHLPIIDFMDWKKGNKMFVENPLPVKYFLTYRNTTTGETQEYLSPNYPFSDSVWVLQWEFVSQRAEDPNTEKSHDLQILDFEGNDYTENFIRNPGYQFLLTAWSLEKADHKSLKKMDDFARAAEADGHSFIALTSSLSEEIDSIKETMSLTYEFYNADDITLKIMVRSNPGLILLENGVVLDKWHYNDFPSYAEFEDKFIQKTQ
ncbi:MAG: DoxX family protein [Lentimicrobium sp.]|nr:DoxX family protein [Lentimicrobium sp.]